MAQLPPLPIDINLWFSSLFRAVTALYKGGFTKTTKNALSAKLDELIITNFNLWLLEDNVRQKDISDTKIAQTKREIDTENQKRHNITDEIDALLRQDIEKTLTKTEDSLPLNSETPGSILDRLTILALRAYHLKKETQRKDADTAHIKRCSCMLKEVEERSNDLLNAFEELLSSYYSGKKRLKSYKEHKLYNDPSFPPRHYFGRISCILL